jgi:hypothetical protein
MMVYSIVRYLQTESRYVLQKLNKYKMLTRLIWGKFSTTGFHFKTVAIKIYCGSCLVNYVIKFETAYN